jgi:hypothetical protein
MAAFDTEPARPLCFSDAIPLRDLDRIARLEEEAIDLERRARALQGRAASFRSLAEGIRAHYGNLIDRDGLEACARCAEEGDVIAWKGGVIL